MNSRFLHEVTEFPHTDPLEYSLMLQIKQGVYSLNRTVALLVLDESYRNFFSRIQGYDESNCLIEIHHTDSFERLIHSPFPIVEVEKSDTAESIQQKCENGRHLHSVPTDCGQKKYRCVLVVTDAQTIQKNYVIVETIYSFLRKHFYFIGTKTFGINSYITFSDRKERVHCRNNTQQYLICGGLGDALISVPGLFYLQYHDDAQNFVSYYSSQKTVEAAAFFTLRTNARHRAIPGMEQFFKRLQHIHLEQFEQFHFHWISPLKDLKQSAFEITNKQYAISTDSHTIFQFFRQNFVLPTSHVLTDFKKKFRYVIGFQRCSATQPKGITCKELPPDVAQEFLYLCRKNQVGVVNLEPFDSYKEQYDLDVSAMEVPQILPLMTELDLFVGIDSCFGHAAALLDVPSVTAFVTTHALYQYAEKYFMPISRNYSLFPVDYITIKGKKLFQVVWDILTGRRQLCRDFTPQDERQEFLHYEFLD